jgi:hypothetical protein
MRAPKRITSCSILAALGLSCASAFAGSLTVDFNSDPKGLLNFAGTEWDGTTATRTGSTYWIKDGGVPMGATTNGPQKGVTGNGFLQITPAGVSSDPTADLAKCSYLCGGAIFNDFDAGLVVAGFTFECDLRIGNGDPAPADGFSISFARATDPVIVAVAAGDNFSQMNNPQPQVPSPNGGQFSDNGSGTDMSLMEEGTTTGLSIGFDMWDSSNYTIPPSPPAVGLVAAGITHDGIGLDIRVDNVLVTTISMPNGTTQGTQDEHGNALTATDTSGANAANDPTSIETGPYDNSIDSVTGLSHQYRRDGLFWCHFKVVLDTDGVLNVYWKTNQILTNFHTTFFPSPGRLVMAARVGGNTANIDLDNLQITTVPSPTAIIGGVTGSPIGFSIQVADSGSSIADTSTINLLFNGAAVTPTTVNKTGGTTLITYKNAASPFPPGVTNTVTLSIKDTSGKQLGPVDRTYVVSSYLTIPAEDAVTGVDTSKPGFVVKTYQVTAALDNTINLAEAVLHGNAGANIADLALFTGGVYNESGPINYSRILASGLVEAIGDYREQLDTSGNPLPTSRPDKQLPGLPSVTDPFLADGVTPNSDNAAMEILTYINFPKAGLYKLICNSDDGFRMQFGVGDAARDQLGSSIVSQFDGGRGASDTEVTVYVAQAGYYPARLLWFNGGGNANVEWIAVNDDGAIGADGTRSLLNDSATTGSIMTYRARTGDTPPVVTWLTPVRGAGQNVLPSNILKVEITDGSKAQVTGTPSLTVNGASVTPTASKNGSVTTVSYTPPGGYWPSGATITNVLTFADNGTPAVTRTNTWVFTTVNWVTVPGSLALPSSAVNTANAGFLIKTYQIEMVRNNAAKDIASPGNSSQIGEYLVRGLFGYPNLADLRKFTGPGGYYVEPTCINYNGGNWSATGGPDGTGGIVGGNAGDFPDDGTVPPNIDTRTPLPGDMPGIPGNPPATLEHGIDNYALEILTVVNFPSAGLYTMNVNSDDGFRVIAGNPKDAFYQVIAEYSGGKGTSRVPRYIRIMQAGLYPLRMVYEEGGGGNSVEWSMINNGSFTDGVGTLDNGSTVLINDTAVSTALKAYQYPVLTTKGAPYVKFFQPARGGSYPGAYYNPSYAVGTAGARPGPDTPIKAILVDGETAVGSVTMTLDGASVTPVVTKTGTETTVLYQPTAQFAAGSRHDVTVTFLDRTLSWYFEVGPIPTPTFFIEAADYNYNSGQTKAEASVMPYVGGAYAGLTGVAGTDLISSGDSDNPYYRYPSTQMVPTSIANDRDRGLGEVQCEFRLGWIGGGQWYNYTRDFPAGKYNVYAALSNGGTGADGCSGALQKVTAGATTPNQTTNLLGVFYQQGTGEWGRNALVPLKDAATTNTLVALDLGSATTLRYVPANGDWDYMVFVPAGQAKPQFKPVKLNMDGSITLTWDGAGTLQTTLSLTPPVTWTDVTGATSPHTLPAPTGNALFGRIKQ